MEITKPEYPGAKILNVDLPLPPDMAQNLRDALESEGPVTYTDGTERPINKVSADQFGVKSMMMIALYPKWGEPWAFGLHQCSYPRVWTSEEERLFQETGRRLTDGLTSLLMNLRVQESERQYRLLADNTLDVIWQTDLDVRFTYVNPSIFQMTGYTPEEFIGTRIQDHCDEDNLMKISQIAAGEMSKPVDCPGTTFEAVLLRKDGSPVSIEAHGKAVFDKNGLPIGFQGVSRDITERKMAEEEQEHLQAQLLQAQKMEAIATLAGGIAHDFNNLLQVVLGYSDMMLFNKKPSDPAYNGLHAIRQAGRDGGELAKSILAFSRRLEPNARPVNLNNVIKRVEKMLERTVTKMIRIEILLTDNLMTVNADPGQMEQILLNLAVNAQHAMPDGGRLTIETANVTLDEDYSRTHLDVEPGKCVLFTVSDTGHGMDKEVVEHIFEPFYTTKGPGEGTGLGLAMVFGIVKSHKGHITCYSEPGTGTTFRIYLPTMVQEIEPDVAVTQQMPAFGTETILLVDDEKSIRKMGEEMLRMVGYSVLTAANGKEALEVYRSNQDRIALVLLDLIMPEMGGKQCLEEILKINPKTRVLIASGFAPNRQTKEALEIGARGFVGKPYNVKGMLQSVREVLDSE